MATKTTFSVQNIADQNSAKALWFFGFAEGLVAIIQSAEWVTEYDWAVRLLPIIAFSLSQFKLLFKTEPVGVKQVGKIIADEGADVQIIKDNEE